MEKPGDEITEEEKEVKTKETQEESGSEVPPKEDEVLEDEEVEDEEGFLEAKERTKKKQKELEEEDIVEERFYTIPLRKVWIVPRKKRAPKAARVVKSFVIKHMKIRTETYNDDEEEEAERLVISNEVNEKLWSKGIEKPPRKIRVRVVKNKEGVVTILLAEGD